MRLDICRAAVAAAAAAAAGARVQRPHLTAHRPFRIVLGRPVGRR